MAKALYVSLTVALVWQFILVAILVRREQGTLRWATAREALWLKSAKPRSGRVGGCVWLILISLIVLFGAAHELVPAIAAPENRDFANLVESDAGKEFLSGAGAGMLFSSSASSSTPCSARNSCLWLPASAHERCFGRSDWVANGLFFTGYHLHVPWGMPRSCSTCSSSPTNEAVPQRLDRDRGPQRPERGARDPHPHARALTASSRKTMRLASYREPHAALSAALGVERASERKQRGGWDGH